MKNYFYLFAFITIFCACSKKESNDPNPTQNTSRFKGFTVNWSTKPKEYFTKTFYYDTEGRIIKSITFKIDSSRTPAKLDSLYTALFYYTSGKNPVSYKYFDYQNSAYSLWGTMQYDSENRLIYDTVIGISSTAFLYSKRTAIQYRTNVIVVNKRLYSNTLITDSIFITNNNVSKITSDNTIQNFLYGNIINPMRNVYESPMSILSVSSSYALFSDNILTTDEYFINGVLDERTTFTHTVDVSGRLIKSRATSTSAGNGTIVWIYE